MPLIRQGPGLVGTAARAGVAVGVAGQGPAPPGAEVGRTGAGRRPAAGSAGCGAAGGARTPDYAAELEKLAQLRDSGVITPEDFEAKKKQLLGI